MNQLAVINELSIYVVLLLVLACESLPMVCSEYIDEILGWVIITLIWLIIHINLVTIMAEAWHHTKLLYQYVMNYRVKTVVKSKTAPVAPKIVDISVEEESHSISQQQIDLIDGVNESNRSHFEAQSPDNILLRNRLAEQVVGKASDRKSP